MAEDAPPVVFFAKAISSGEEDEEVEDEEADDEEDDDHVYRGAGGELFPHENDEVYAGGQVIRHLEEVATVVKANWVRDAYDTHRD